MFLTFPASQFDPRFQQRALDPVDEQCLDQHLPRKLDPFRRRFTPSHLIPQGIVTERDCDGSFQIRICRLHRWESRPSYHAADEPDRCPQCVALVDAVPGEDRFVRRFGER